MSPSGSSIVTAYELIGSWTNNREYGGLYDPESAFHEGARGIWWRFYEDGTFEEIVLSSNATDSGITEYYGDYDVRGNAIRQTYQHKAWIPDPSRNDQPEAYGDRPVDDGLHVFRFVGPDMAIINLDGNDITFYRLW
jgi:hypothetical protein